MKIENLETGLNIWSVILAVIGALMSINPKPDQEIIIIILYALSGIFLLPAYISLLRDFQEWRKLKPKMNFLKWRWSKYEKD